MRHTTFCRSRGALWVGIFILASMIEAFPAMAAEDVTGEWQITVDFDGRPMLSTLVLSKKADSTLDGTWGSSALSNVKFDGQKLTFVRTIRFGDQEFTMNYTGTLKDGKLAGTLSSDRGDMAANGARKKPKSPVLGQWDIKFSVMDREIAPRLVISEKPDGTLACQWTKEDGEHVVSNVKFQDGKLTLTRKSKIQDMDEFETTYEGTVKGNELTGVLKGQMGDLPANGQRVGAALIGKWDLATTSDFGPSTGRMMVDGDLTGTYEFFGGELPMKDLKLEGDQLTFKVEMGFGDQTFQMDFKGKLDGKTLKGQMNSERGTSEVTGKKIEATAAAAPPAAVAAAPAALVGTWELTTETPNGTRTNTLKIKADMTGTYTGRDNETPIKDLKVEGNQVTFKSTRTFNDQEVTMEFKGKLEGTSLKGEFTSDRGTRSVTGKKVN